MMLQSGTFTRASFQSASFYSSSVKRACDVVFASVLFVCCLPLIIAAALMIMLDGQGPPLFRQKRIGRNGAPFILYKLRTMCDGSEHLGFRTEAGDPRITKVGAFLRDTKLDELPQLWNVIKGEMSLIGPRPLSMDETAHLIQSGQFTVDSAGFIPTVQPGLTGWEQCTRSSLQPYEHRFNLNNYYETHLSLWLDLWVIKRTMQACPTVCLFSLFSAILTIVVLLPMLQ